MMFYPGGSPQSGKFLFISSQPIDVISEPQVCDGPTSNADVP